jgi:hypothetical protein
MKNPEATSDLRKRRLKTEGVVTTNCFIVTTKDGKKHIFILGSAEEFEKFVKAIMEKKNGQISKEK